MGQEPRGGVFEGLRRMVTGAALLGIGCAIGLVIGTVSNVPELLLAWAGRDATSVDLAAAEPAPSQPVTELQEFPKLQEAAKPGPRPSTPAPERVPQVASPPPPPAV